MYAFRKTSARRFDMRGFCVEFFVVIIYTVYNNTIQYSFHYKMHTQKHDN